MNQRNMSTPQSPSSGSAVLHTRKAESTLDTQAGTTHPSAVNDSSKLGASLRTSQHRATTQDRQNWSKSVGGISHSTAIPTDQEMTDFYRFWNEKGEQFCQEKFGPELFAKCYAYYNSIFPNQ
ncbi:hypothetical protein DPMN_116242 [Dreissena polymorpha]|uniref:Uncharacterized protein n=1 Tax=Dreissena polymorpha TaxID=45954 RepID=A0A9D4KMS0_DREPO|nr:hypothetical protein DPMN_116242 [Dreissena polymorpha]